MSVQFPYGKARRAVLWGIGICAGLLLFTLISNYYHPPMRVEDTYKNIVKKREVLSQMRINLLKSVEMERDAVMAQTDEESQVFADQSLAASAAVEQDQRQLNSLIDAAPMQDERNLVIEFNNCWTELRKLDQVILELAVQNTNLKAVNLSREKGAEAMQRFEHALEDVMRPYLGAQNEGPSFRRLHWAAPVAPVVPARFRFPSQNLAPRRTGPGGVCATPRAKPLYVPGRLLPTHRLGRMFSTSPSGSNPRHRHAGLPDKPAWRVGPAMTPGSDPQNLRKPTKES